MDRREFLLHVGALFMLITGVSAILKNLSDPNPIKEKSGYGSGKYGGISKGGSI